jgi:chromosome segregation ATPase
MLDSRKGGAMADRIDHLTERVLVVEEKVDHLTERVVVVEEKVDHLTERVVVVEEKVDHLSTSMDQLSTSVDQLSTSVDERFNAVDAALLEQRQYTEFGYARLDVKMDVGFARVERKLDQFIDVQLQTNELVDRRLRRLEQQDRTPDSQP